MCVVKILLLTIQIPQMPDPCMIDVFSLCDMMATCGNNVTNCDKNYFLSSYNINYDGVNNNVNYDNVNNNSSNNSSNSNEDNYSDSYGY